MAARTTQTGVTVSCGTQYFASASGVLYSKKFARLPAMQCLRHTDCELLPKLHAHTAAQHAQHGRIPASCMLSCKLTLLEGRTESFLLDQVLILGMVRHYPRPVLHVMSSRLVFADKLDPTSTAGTST